MRNGSGVSGTFRRLCRVNGKQPRPQQNAASEDGPLSVVLMVVGLLALGILSGVLGLMLRVVLRNWI
jgi:hypothetical protein